MIVGSSSSGYIEMLWMLETSYETTGGGCNIHM